jgi:hypothetical protein
VRRRENERVRKWEGECVKGLYRLGTWNLLAGCRLSVVGLRLSVNN